MDSPIQLPGMYSIKMACHWRLSAPTTGLLKTNTSPPNNNLFMKYFLVLTLVACAHFVTAQDPNGLALIPEPHALKQLPGKFSVNRGTVLSYNDTEAKIT